MNPNATLSSILHLHMLLSFKLLESIARWFSRTLDAVSLNSVGVLRHRWHFADVVVIDSLMWL